MKKHGFTLVEMLAVLVLIIAIFLIVFPSIVNYINSSKGDISDVTKEMILSNAKLYVSDNKDMFFEVLDNTYCVTVGTLVDKNYMDISFKDAVSGKEIDQNKKIKIQYVYDEDLGKNVFKYDIDDNCTSIDNSVLCTAKETVTSGNLAYGRYNYGDEYSCDVGDGEAKTFYVLENNDDTVSLIMNMNIDSEGKGSTRSTVVSWCASGGVDSSCAADGAIAYLESSTTSWTKLNESQISLPTFDQIYVLKDEENYLPMWVKENAGDHGYWTSTAGGDSAYAVDENGITSSGVDSSSCAIRPVITISKSKIYN